MPRSKVVPKKRPITSWNDAPVLMKTDYAALLLGISSVTLQRLVKAGEIPVVKLGPKSWRFEKSALMAWAGVQERP